MISFLFRSSRNPQYKLVFYVPTTHLRICKDAVFAAGAGRYPGAGNYTECCWTALGTGQFKPGNGAKPYKGKVNVLAEEEEARVETLCVGKAVAKRAVEALKKYVLEMMSLDLPCQLTQPIGHTHTRSQLMRFTRWRT